MSRVPLVGQIAPRSAEPCRRREGRHRLFRPTGHADSGGDGRAASHPGKGLIQKRLKNEFSLRVHGLNNLVKGVEAPVSPAFLESLEPPDVTRSSSWTTSPSTVVAGHGRRALTCGGGTHRAVYAPSIDVVGGRFASFSSKRAELGHLEGRGRRTDTCNGSVTERRGSAWSTGSAPCRSRSSARSKRCRKAGSGRRPVGRR